MVDAEDETQVKWALQKLKASPAKTVVLVSGDAEELMKKHPGKIYPLKRWQAEEWGVEYLPAVVELTEEGEVVIREGMRVVDSIKKLLRTEP